MLRDFLLWMGWWQLLLSFLTPAGAYFLWLTTPLGIVLAIAIVASLHFVFTLSQFLLWRRSVGLGYLQARPENEHAFVWLGDVVFFVINRRWPKPSENVLPPINDETEGTLEWRRRIEGSDTKSKVVGALDVIRQAAFDGKLLVEGRERARDVLSIGLDVVGDRLFVPIPKEHWNSHLVNWEVVGFQPEQTFTQPKDGIFMDGQSYCSLRFLSRDVEELFTQ